MTNGQIKFFPFNFANLINFKFSRQLIAAFMQRICQGTADNHEYRRSRIMAPSSAAGRVGRQQQRARASNLIDNVMVGNEGGGQTIHGTSSRK